MKLRYFGDRQDFFKWNALREELKEQDYFLFYVAMFTDLYGRNIGDEGDSFFRGIKNLRDEVTLFLDERLSSLFREGFYSRTVVVTDGYRKTERESYFRSLCERIREAKKISLGEPLLIFLDPDTGLGPESGGDDGHLMEDSLRSVLEMLHEDDRILIYQHRQRVADNKADFDIRAQQLSRQLDLWGQSRRSPKMIDLGGARANSYLIRV